MARDIRPRIPIATFLQGESSRTSHTCDQTVTKPSPFKLRLLTGMETRVHEPGSTWDQSVGYADSELIGLEQMSKVIGELHRWVDPYVLASWVVSEADALSCGVTMEGTMGRKTESDSRAVLSILAYSYVIGVYSSEEVVRNCRTNDAFAVLAGGKFLFRHELKWFRCRHRPLLTQLVGRIFVRATCEWYGLGQTDIAPHIESYLRRLAVERLDIARHLDTIDE